MKINMKNTVTKMESFMKLFNLSKLALLASLAFTSSAYAVNSDDEQPAKRKADDMDDYRATQRKKFAAVKAQEEAQEAALAAAQAQAQAQAAAEKQAQEDLARAKEDLIRKQFLPLSNAFHRTIMHCIQARSISEAIPMLEALLNALQNNAGLLKNDEHDQYVQSQIEALKKLFSLLIDALYSNPALAIGNTAEQKEDIQTIKNIVAQCAKALDMGEIALEFDMYTDNDAAITKLAAQEEDAAYAAQLAQDAELARLFAEEDGGLPIAAPAPHGEELDDDLAQAIAASQADEELNLALAASLAELPIAQPAQAPAAQNGGILSQVRASLSSIYNFLSKE
jgi:hypothetical protein